MRRFSFLFATCVLSACANKAIEEGSCDEGDQALFDTCVDAGCSAEMSKSANGLDECEADGNAWTGSAGGECAFEGSGSCYILCDCSRGGSGGDEGGSTIDDVDGDGYPAAQDCDDTDASVFPGAEDSVGDGVDNNCDGVDGVDADGDGVASAVSGGADCDDADASTTDADGDADCDGVPDVGDCDPEDAAVGGVADEARSISLDGMTFALVCGHIFPRGCTEGPVDCEVNEVPVADVTLTRDFLVSTTEVTRAGFEAKMGYDPSYPWAEETCDDCPVDTVSWYEAAAYANELSDDAGLQQCYRCSGEGRDVTCEVWVNPYTCAGYRLPTEAEWEAAARCGQDTLYAGGDSLEEIAWVSPHSGGMPHPVAGLQPNACGIYDMSGNVLEWTNDFYYSSYYEENDVVDPAGWPTLWTGMSWRGGNSGNSVRLTYRGYNNPDSRYPGYGFRVVRIAP